MRDRASGVEHSVERPDVIRHRSELDAADDAHGPSGAEPMSIGAALGRRTGLTRLGIHHERSRPDGGPRCRMPKARRRLRARRHAGYLDRRHLHRLRPGDAVAFSAGTGICRTFRNDTDTDTGVRLLIAGETPEPRTGSDLRGTRRSRLVATIAGRTGPCLRSALATDVQGSSHEPASRQRPALRLSNAGTRAVAMTIAPIQGSDP